MKSITYGRTAPPSALPRIFLMLGMLVIGGAGSLVLLVAAGVVDLPFLHGKAAEKPRPLGIAIPLSARPIPAYTQVVRDHFMDAKTLDLVVVYLSPEEVEKNGFLTADKVIGRVLANDKGAGYTFKEKDFLPPGTKPGMAAGVPNGKRSYVLDAREVDGANDLKIGDHIDVLTGAMLEFDKITQRYHTIPVGRARSAAKAPDYKPGQQATVVALAHDAVVVLPLTTREVPDESAPIPPATGKPKMRVARDLTIAIDPKEAPALAGAVAVDAAISCVAHTGLPNDSPSVPPGVPVLVAAQPVHAYARVIRDDLIDRKTLDDDLIDRKTLDLLVAYYPPEEVEKKGYLTDEKKIIGRVLANDKVAGDPFTDKDFLSDDARPGMTAGVPHGKRSYVLDARQVAGANDLKIGDHIDVLAAVMMEFDKTTRQYHTIPTAPNRTAGKKEYGPGQTGVVVALAQNAVVVQPLTTRDVPDKTVQAGGADLRTAQDVTIAIDPKEAGPLTEAVAVGAEIFCVAHTGLASDVPGVTPSFIPLAPVQTVELIVSGKHEVKVYPDPSGKTPSWSLTPGPSDQKAPPPVLPPVNPGKIAEESKGEASTDAEQVDR